MALATWIRPVIVTKLVSRLQSIAYRARHTSAQDVREHLEAFVRWWAAELWDCLPPAWRERLRFSRTDFLLKVEGGEARVVVVDRLDAQRNFSFALAPRSKPDAASLAGLRRAIRSEGARIDVLVADAAIARRRLD